MRKRPELLVGVAVAAILLLAVIAVVVSSMRGTTNYPAGSPERALQQYLEAVTTGAKVEAFSYIAEDSPCTQRDMDMAYVIDVSRIDIDSSRVIGDRATIDVRLELDNDFVFGSGYTEEHTFILVKEMGEWRITGGAWPMYSCGEWVK